MSESRPDGSAGAPAGAAVGWAGAPLRSTMLFLAVPVALVVVGRLLGTGLPGWLLYGVAATMGLVLLWRSASDPEWLLAVVVIYIPLKKVYVASVAPGINGTNALLLLLLFAWLVQSLRGSGYAHRARANAALVGIWAALTLFSTVTAAVAIGVGEFAGTYLADVKAWVDQFVVFYAFLGLIRDGRMARRVMVYMMLGMLVVLGMGIEEWLQKRFMASIERSRVLGPHLQPNDYGAFLVYSAAAFLSVLLANLNRVAAWLTIPSILYFYLKILIATFSRGAYVGFAVAGLVAGFVRGRLFLLTGAIAAAVLFVIMPELVPESLSARMSQTGGGPGAAEEELDASSRNRLVLWRAGIDMTLDNPLLGAGFRMFPVYKGRYTEFDVRESDNHNMFLYVSSQMGVPALLVILLILWRMFRMGARIYRDAPDPFARAIGMAAASTVGGTVAVNMFGSRMVDIGVTAHFWVLLAIVAHLLAELDASKAAGTAAGNP